MKQDNSTTIPARLRQAREAAGLSQGQVAKKMDFHRPTITEIEAGRRRVSAEELSIFADIYGVSVNWLVHGFVAEENGINERTLLAARELSKMSDEDLDRIMSLIKMLKTNEGA
jgi:transcriptional regulator with XRE-family HTH domain